MLFSGLFIPYPSMKAYSSWFFQVVSTSHALQLMALPQLYLDNPDYQLPVPVNGGIITYQNRYDYGECCVT